MKFKPGDILDHPISLYFRQIVSIHDGYIEYNLLSKPGCVFLGRQRIRYESCSAYTILSDIEKAQYL
jgi:hypothetical protein